MVALYRLILTVVTLTFMVLEVESVTDQQFQDLASIVFELKDEVKELRPENNLLKNVLKEIVKAQLDDNMCENMKQQLIQNATIEERVTLLEIQVEQIQDDVTGLTVGLMEVDENVDFLFDEQVIQDERLLNLETETEGIEEEVEVLQSLSTELDIRVTALEENGGDDGNSSVAELEVRVETLEGTAADHETRISATEVDIEDLETTTIDLDSRVADHETRLTAAEENIQGLQMTDVNHDARITALEENGGGGSGNNGTIAFNALLTSPITINVGEAVIFDEATVNEGDGYNSETGVFTFPEDGLYFVSTFLRGGASVFALFDMELNDEKLCTATTDQWEDNESTQATCSSVFFASQGDEVKVVYVTGDTTNPLWDAGSYLYHGFFGFRI